ncbi:MAG TPA: Rieske 2Fe-2S domain-containing protein [Stellaceae bacterium]|nr:Rieske 2Fe-2S domain-containing protein [Stellaceae bacterium]
MLTPDENELLTRTGAATAMGDYLRDRWTPAVRAGLLEADGAPARVRLYGRNYVAFRATDGRVGFLDEECPHRRVSLAIARNEDNALRCLFHGWKIDVSGRLVEAPSEPPERQDAFCAAIRINRYPVREAGGLIWVYLGTRASPPPFAEFEFTRLPESHVDIRRAVVHCNWLQGFEGTLDTVHAGILHVGWIGDPAKRWQGAQGAELHVLSRKVPSATIEFAERGYGFREGALRALPDGSVYVRIRDVALPYYSFIPTPGGAPCFVTIVVPIDDETHMQWYIIYDPAKPIPDAARERLMAGSSGDRDDFASDLGGWDNRWNQDRGLMKQGHWTGIARSLPLEDFAVQEAMGPIADRSGEQLGSSDVTIVRTRRLLLDAARRHRAGETPAETGHDAIRALAIRLAPGADWRAVDTMNPPPSLADAAE